MSRQFRLGLFVSIAAAVGLHVRPCVLCMRVTGAGTTSLVAAHVDSGGGSGGGSDGSTTPFATAPFATAPSATAPSAMLPAPMGRSGSPRLRRRPTLGALALAPQFSGERTADSKTGMGFPRGMIPAAATRRSGPATIPASFSASISGR